MADQLVVLESFSIEVGGTPVTYRKGELVDPADPVTRTHAAMLGPFAYPHPVRAPRETRVEAATAAPGQRRR